MARSWVRKILLEGIIPNKNRKFDITEQKNIFIFNRVNIVLIHCEIISYYDCRNILEDFGPDLDDAKESFEKQFLDKTRNEWKNRHNFKV